MNQTIGRNPMATLGRYRLESLIHRGPSSHVYRATHELLRTRVAVKFLNDGSAARATDSLQRELAALSRLRHLPAVERQPGEHRRPRRPAGRQRHQHGIAHRERHLGPLAQKRAPAHHLQQLVAPAHPPRRPRRRQKHRDAHYRIRLSRSFRPRRASCGRCRLRRRLTEPKTPITASVSRMK